MQTTGTPQRRQLTLLMLSLVSLVLAACGQATPSKTKAEPTEMKLIELAVSPEVASVPIGGSVEFSVTHVRVSWGQDGTTEKLGASERGLSTALASGIIDSVEHSAIKDALASIEWSPEDRTAATVTGDGVTATASGLMPGMTEVNAILPMAYADPQGYDAVTASAKSSGKAPRYHDVTATVNLTVLGKAEPSLKVSQESVTLNVDGRVDLGVEPTDEEPGGQEVQYSSSDQSVATVSDDGTVTAVSEGHTTITVKYGMTTLKVEIDVVPLQYMLLTETGDDVGWVLIGEVLPLVVTAIDAEGNVTDVSAEATSWTSSDESIAVVDDAGVVTGVAPGQATIRAVVNGVSLEIAVTVPSSEGTYTHLELTPSDSLLAVGTSINLRATASGFAPDRDITDEVTIWESTDDSVAIVDDHGRVTGVSVGTVDILGEFYGLRGSLTLVVAAGTALIITPDIVNLHVGSQEQLTATVALADGTSEDVTDFADWTSDEVAIASADPGGLITGQYTGKAVVTATFGGLYAEVIVFVGRVEPTRLIISPSPASLPVGAQLQLSAILEFSDSSTKDFTASATWSSDSDVVSVAVGTLIAQAQGQAIVTASADGMEATVTVMVLPPEPVSLSATPASLTLGAQMSADVRITATLTDQSSLDVTSSAEYSSSDEAVVSVANGRMEAQSEGTASITVTLGELSLEIPVTVTGFDEIISIGVSPNPLSVAPGFSQEVTATATFVDGASQLVTESANLTWSIANQDVATVNQAGVVTGVNIGQTTVTATYDDGVNEPVVGYGEVIVPSVPFVALALSESEARVPTGYSQRFNALATFADGVTSNATLEANWSIADTNIATVSVEGGAAIVQAVAPGNTQLIGELDGFMTTATITVVDVQGSNYQISPQTSLGK